MSTSSYSGSTTFTVTHAKELAVKVATDLKRMQRFYNEPSDNLIADYELEITIEADDSQLAYGRANRAINGLDAISHSDLHRIVSIIKALPPYKPPQRNHW